MLGALGRVGRGFGSAKRVGAVLGALCGVWLWWAGVGFGRAGCAGSGWAWGLALVGALGLCFPRWILPPLYLSSGCSTVPLEHCLLPPRTLTHLGDFSLDIA